MRALTFSDLDGWAADDLTDVLDVYVRTRPSAYPVPQSRYARAFFERWFRPVLIHPSAVITGYFEPVLTGSLHQTHRFRWPLHAFPLGENPSAPRAELLDSGCLAGHELVWLDDPLDAFLAQVQGSVRVNIDGTDTVLRLAYAGRNGQPYRSIGAELVARNAIPAAPISTQTIRAWCRANPDQIDDLLRLNPSYVFFRLLDLAPALGPLGTSGQPLTPLRSLAADLTIIPPGAPVWVETSGTADLHRLFVAQDTGSAITGPARIDLYFGSGADAGESAGRMNELGRVIALVPQGAAT